jgi:hypothetical protein
VNRVALRQLEKGTPVDRVFRAEAFNFTESDTPDHVCIVFQSQMENMLVHLPRSLLNHLSQDAADLHKGMTNLRRRRI